MLRAPRALAGSAVRRDTLVVAGGFGPRGPVADVDAFVEGVRSGPGGPALPPLSEARGGLALASDGASLFAVGGQDASNARVPTVERLGRAGTAWTRLADLPAPREDAVAAVIGRDLYVAGGATAFGTVLASMVRLSGVAVASDPAAPPAARFGLALAGPNPTRGRVRFHIASEGAVRLSILDMRGRTVAVVDAPAGTREVSWDASGVAPGVYAARLDGRAGAAVVRFVVVR